MGSKIFGCPSCGGPRKEAGACPHCGAALPRNGAWRAIAALAGAGGMVTLMACYGIGVPPPQCQPGEDVSGKAACEENSQPTCICYGGAADAGPCYVYCTTPTDGGTDAGADAGTDGGADGGR